MESKPPLEHLNGQIFPHPVKPIGALFDNTYSTLSVLLSALGKCSVSTTYILLKWENGSSNHVTFSMSATDHDMPSIFVMNSTDMISAYSMEMPSYTRLTMTLQRNYLLNHT